MKPAFSGTWTMHKSNSESSERKCRLFTTSSGFGLYLSTIKAIAQSSTLAGTAQWLLFWLCVSHNPKASQLLLGWLWERQQQAEEVTAGGQGIPSRKQQLPHSLGRNIHVTVTSKSACAARTPLASFVQPKRVSWRKGTTRVSDRGWIQLWCLPCVCLLWWLDAKLPITENSWRAYSAV